MQDVKPSAAREYAMYKYDALFELIGKELTFSHRVTRPSVCPSTRKHSPAAEGLRHSRQRLPFPIIIKSPYMALSPIMWNNSFFY